MTAGSLTTAINNATMSASTLAALQGATPSALPSTASLLGPSFAETLQGYLAPATAAAASATASVAQGTDPALATLLTSGGPVVRAWWLPGSPAVAAGASGAASSTNGTVTGAPTTLGQAAVTDAQRYLGVPYVWGGTNPAVGFDCSGLVQHVYADLGVSLPRTSQQQATIGTPVASLAQAQPGDLVFFEPSASGPGHVGLYLGGGAMIDAPHPGTAVQIQQITTPPCAIRRVAGANALVTLQSTAQLVASSGLTTSGPPGISTVSGLGSSSATTTSLQGGSGLLSGASVPQALVPLFLQAAARYGIPPQLLAAVGRVESNFNPNAVSSAGAQGLMQIMPATAAGLGVNPFDPAQAINGAAQMLAGSLAHFGSAALAVAAYNAGAGAVEAYGGIPPYAQTQAYVRSVLSFAGMTNAPGGTLA